MTICESRHQSLAILDNLDILVITMDNKDGEMIEQAKDVATKAGYVLEVRKKNGRRGVLEYRFRGDQGYHSSSEDRLASDVAGLIARRAEEKAKRDAASAAHEETMRQRREKAESLRRALAARLGHDIPERVSIGPVTLLVDDIHDNVVNLSAQPSLTWEQFAELLQLARK